MRSYIKIYGPPMYQAIKALEKIAFDFPEMTIMDTLLEYAFPENVTDEDAFNYFNAMEINVPRKRTLKIISKSGVNTGAHDFYFEWGVNPTFDQLTTLITKIDEALAPIGCRYTITTK